MSFYVADANGYLADVASNGGMADFDAWAEATGDATLLAFVHDGHTDDPAALAKALDALIASNPDIDHTREGLQAAAEKADSVLIVSDGVTSSDNEDKTVKGRADQPRDDHGRWGSGGGKVSVDHGREPTSDEVNLLQRWHGDPVNDFMGTYDAINGGLRFGKLTASEKRDAKALNDLIGRSTLKKDAVFFRGVSIEMLDHLEEGKAFTDKGFTSLTTSKKTAELFTGSGYEGNHGVIMQVRVPSGTHVLDVSKAMGLKHGSAEDEGEHLLPSGTKFKVVSASRGKYVLEVKK